MSVCSVLSLYMAEWGLSCNNLRVMAEWIIFVLNGLILCKTEIGGKVVRRGVDHLLP